VSRGCIDGVEEEPLNVKKERPQIQVERLDLPAFGCPTGLNSSCCQVFKMPSLSGEFKFLLRIIVKSIELFP